MTCAFCGHQYRSERATKQTRCPQCQRTRDEQLADCAAYFARHDAACVAANDRSAREVCCCVRPRGGK